MRQMMTGAARDVLYPRRCAGCGRRGMWVCGACAPTSPPFAPPWCARCGAPTDRATCRCNELVATLDRVRSAGSYDGWLRSAVIAFKYEGETDRAEHLGDLMLATIADLLPADALVPVPLHPRRLRERGYNQAVLLAGHAGKALGVPVRALLERTRATDQQARLGANDRWTNVRGAFAVRENVDVQSMRIVLIDDVLTTGATLSACAEAFVAAGAVSVSAATLAREG